MIAWSPWRSLKLIFLKENWARNYLPAVYYYNSFNKLQMERANTKHQPIFKIFTILDSGEYVEPGKHRADMNFQHFYIWHTLLTLHAWTANFGLCQLSSADPRWNLRFRICDVLKKDTAIFYTHNAPKVRLSSWLTRKGSKACYH